MSTWPKSLNLKEVTAVLVDAALAGDPLDHHSKQTAGYLSAALHFWFVGVGRLWVPGRDQEQIVVAVAAASGKE